MTWAAREVHLVSRPDGELRESDFRIVDTEVDAPADGRFVVGNRYLSLDPYLRLTMSPTRAAHGMLALDRVVPALAVGTVIASAHPDFPVGATVTGRLGWRDYLDSSGKGVSIVDTGALPASAALGPLGMPGFTAWTGMTFVGQPKPGDAVYVSAAAGAVGSIAGQLALKAGARVIGSAGGAAKVEWLKSVGFEAFDYRTRAVGDALAEFAPEGIHLFFDNVGGEQLEAGIEAMAYEGLVVSCGAVSLYQDDDRAVSGPRNLNLLSQRALTLAGFQYGQYEAERPRFETEMRGLLADGSVVFAENVTAGLENTPRAYIESFADQRIGKPLIEVEGTG